MVCKNCNNNLVNGLTVCPNCGKNPYGTTARSDFDIRDYKYSSLNVRDNPFATRTGPDYDAVPGIRNAASMAKDLIDNGSPGVEIVIPQGDYYFKSYDTAGGFGWCVPIERSNITVRFEKGAKVYSSLTATLALFAACGTFKPAGPASWRNYWLGLASTATYYSLPALLQGQGTITLSNVGDGANFAVNDWVYIRTGQTITNSDLVDTEPDAEINQVVGVSGDTLTLRWRLSKPYNQEWYITPPAPGPTSTTPTAAPAVYGIAKVTNRIIENIAFIDPNIEASGVGANSSCFPFWAQAVYDFTISGLRGKFNGSFGHVHEIRRTRFLDWVNHFSPPGTFSPMAVGVATGMTDVIARDIETTAVGRCAYLHAHEGAADVLFDRVKIKSANNNGDGLPPVHVANRAYDQEYRDLDIMSEAAASPMQITPSATGGGNIVRNPRIRSNDQTTNPRGILGEAPGWSYLDVPYLTWIAQRTGGRTPAAPVDLQWLVGLVRWDNQTITLGYIPTNSMVVDAVIDVSNQAFNGGTNNRITIGNTGNAAEYITSTVTADVGTTGRKDLSTSLGTAYRRKAITQKIATATYTAGGAPQPTTGTAFVAIAYIILPELL